MIYQVTIDVPAFSEIVTLAADTEDEAKALAIASATQRLVESATVTVKPSN
jgi:hypothetical protein